MKMTFLRLAVILVVALVSMAPAPRGSIQYAGLVLKNSSRLTSPLTPMIFLETGLS